MPVITDGPFLIVCAWTRTRPVDYGMLIGGVLGGAHRAGAGMVELAMRAIMSCIMIVATGWVPRCSLSR